MTKPVTIAMAAVAILASLLPAAVSAADSLQHAQRWQLNMPRGVTPLSHTIYELHMVIFWICVAIGAVVYGAMFYAMGRTPQIAGC